LIEDQDGYHTVEVVTFLPASISSSLKYTCAIRIYFFDFSGQFKLQQTCPDHQERIFDV